MISATGYSVLNSHADWQTISIAEDSGIGLSRLLTVTATSSRASKAIIDKATTYSSHNIRQLKTTPCSPYSRQFAPSTPRNGHPVQEQTTPNPAQESTQQPHTTAPKKSGCSLEQSCNGQFRDFTIGTLLWPHTPKPATLSRPCRHTRNRDNCDPPIS